jgi:Glyoxalase-like domain
MRLITFLILSILPLRAADLRIDHITVAGVRLEAMRQAFTSATGLATEYGGRHGNHATEMALTSFPDGSYVELMGIQAEGDAAAIAAHDWSKFLKSDAGPCAFAIRAGEGSLLAKLQSSGIEMKTPARSGRTRPDGTRLEWEITDIGPGVRGGLFPFLIRDVTARENRAFVKGEPTTRNALGVAKVVVGVHNLDMAISLYRRAFGLAAPKRQQDAEFGANLAWFEGTPIVLAQPLANDFWLARRVAQYGDSPCAFILRSAGGMTRVDASRWFGSPIKWSKEPQFGWRLGMEDGL